MFSISYERDLDKRIQKFCEAEVADFLHKVLEKGCLDEILQAAKEGLPQLFLSFLKEHLEALDEGLKAEPNIRNQFSVHRISERTVETSLGTLRFSRRYFQDLETGKRVFLLDKEIGLQKRCRVTKELEASMLSLSASMSYRKSANLASQGRVSRATLMNKLHNLELPKEHLEESRQEVPEIHLQCDEDHVAMQDGSSTIARLVVMHEPTPKGKTLRNRHIFTSTPGESTEHFWTRICTGVEERYGRNEELKVYVHGDGAWWIKKGVEYFRNSQYILDKFHFNKYVTAVYGSYDGPRDAMYEFLERGEKDNMIKLAEALCGSECCSEETKDSFVSYLRNNWIGIRVWKDLGTRKSSSCAEGLVSNFLSERLSSRPHAWGATGLEKVVAVRTFLLNGHELTLDIMEKSRMIQEEEIRRKQRRQNPASNGSLETYVVHSRIGNGKSTGALAALRHGISRGGYHL